MRLIFVIALFFLLLDPLAGHRRHRPDNLSQIVIARPINMASDQRLAAPGDQLRFIRGWNLMSDHSHFGGFSAMALVAPRRFQLIGDAGWWSRLTLGEDGRVRDVVIRPLPRPAGSPARTGKAYVDAEALAYDPATRQSLIALESIDQIWRINPAMTQVIARRHIAAMTDWPPNGGSEAMVRLDDGRTLILSEAANDDARGTKALLFHSDPLASSKVPERFFYDAGGKGLVSDAAQLPDGRVLIIHRRLGPSPLFTTILAVADPADIAADGVWKSREIGRVPVMLRENYEGTAIEVDQGRTYVWLISDSNFNIWQRSLLLQFELRPLPASKKGGTVAGPP